MFYLGKINCPVIHQHEGGHMSVGHMTHPVVLNHGDKDEMVMSIGARESNVQVTMNAAEKGFAQFAMTFFHAVDQGSAKTRVIDTVFSTVSLNSQSRLVSWRIPQEAKGGYCILRLHWEEAQFLEKIDLY